MNATSDPNLARTIVNDIRFKSTTNVSLFTEFADDDNEIGSLRWAEVIPLSFLNETLKNTKVLIFGNLIDDMMKVYR